MSDKKKPDIKRLKYPLWSQIVFFVLTVVAPIVFIMVEGYQSPRTGFKITFSLLCGLVVGWSFLSKFVLGKFEHKWRDRQSKLEHDYEIDVGNADKIRWLWFNNEMKLNACTAVKIALWGSLLAVVLNEVAEGFMKIKGMIILIAICYVLAYMLKFAVIAAAKGAETYEDDEQQK